MLPIGVLLRCNSCLAVKTTLPEGLSCLHTVWSHDYNGSHWALHIQFCCCCVSLAYNLTARVPTGHGFWVSGVITSCSLVWDAPSYYRLAWLGCDDSNPLVGLFCPSFFCSIAEVLDTELCHPVCNEVIANIQLAVPSITHFNHVSPGLAMMTTNLWEGCPAPQISANGWDHGCWALPYILRLPGNFQCDWC